MYSYILVVPAAVEPYISGLNGVEGDCFACKASKVSFSENEHGYATVKYVRASAGTC